VSHDPAVRKAFDDLAASAQPQGDWQAKVWARIAREPEERRQRRRLRAWQWIAAGLVVALGALTLVVVLQDKKYEEVAAANIKKLEEFERKVAMYQAEIDALIEAKSEEFARIVEAKTEEERVAAQARQREIDRQLAVTRALLAELRDRAQAKDRRTRERKKRVQVKCDPNDPLCGL